MKVVYDKEKAKALGKDHIYEDWMKRFKIDPKEPLTVVEMGVLGKDSKVTAPKSGVWYTKQPPDFVSVDLGVYSPYLDQDFSLEDYL